MPCSLGLRLAYKPYFFSQRTVFFSHNKSANSTFSHGLSAKRTGHFAFSNDFGVELKIKIMHLICFSPSAWGYKLT